MSAQVRRYDLSSPGVKSGILNVKIFNSTFNIQNSKFIVMITYEEALHIISEHHFEQKVETVPLNKANGRVLAQQVTADRDLPPYDRVTMDGIAICFGAYAVGRRTFSIEKTIGAGTPKSSLENAGHCVQIMTGAIMPRGADTVIRYEDVTIADGTATLNEEVFPQQNIHFKGEDKKAGEVVLMAGKTLDAPDLIAAAAVGCSELEVVKLPKAAIITTGDELTGIDESPLAHQVRRSGNYGIQNLLTQWGLESQQYHLKDDKKQMKDALSIILKRYDLLVITGGVSKGKFDHLPEVLTGLGVEKHFHKVAQRPGKPFWFGTAKGTTVFALPGNQVSSFACTLVYIRHWLQSSQGQSTELSMIQLVEDVTFMPNLTCFQECSIEVTKQGQLVAKALKGNGSGDFAKLTQADGFVVLPQNKNVFKAGEFYPFIPLRVLSFKC